MAEHLLTLCTTVCVAALQVRDLENAFSTALNAVAPSFVERYGAASDNPELESMPEEAQLLLQDKDAMMNAIQVCAGS